MWLILIYSVLQILNKRWPTQWMNEWNNDKSVFRTAPATRVCKKKLFIRPQQSHGQYTFSPLVFTAHPSLMGKRYASSYKIDIVAQFDDILNHECFLKTAPLVPKLQQLFQIGVTSESVCYQLIYPNFFLRNCNRF